MRMPAHCPSCGLIFNSALEVQGGAVAISGVTQNCPRCGERAAVIDGDFEVIGGDILRVISAPEQSEEVLRRISEVLKSGIEKEESRESVIGKVEAISPETASILKPFEGADASTWLFMLGLIYAASRMVSVSVHVDFNRLLDQAAEYVQQFRQNDEEE